MILYGASGHAKVIIDILNQNGIDIQAIYDDDPAIKALIGYPVTKPEAIGTEPMIIAIGRNDVRKTISEKLDRPYGKAVHPSAIIDPSVEIGEGSVVMANATINHSSVIGRHAIVNTSASIDHDCEIGDYVHISPKTCLCGGVKIGEGTHVGAGSVIIPGVYVGAWSVIGAGSVVIGDIPDHVVAVGNPAKIIKKVKYDI